MLSMTIEVVTDAVSSEWVVFVNGRRVMALRGLSPEATPTEAQMFAEQTFVEMVRGAMVYPATAQPVSP